jgi:hypothetical protein
MEFRDHLNCQRTYTRLTPFQTAFARGQLLMTFTDWIKSNRCVITKNEDNYFKLHIASTTDTFGALYLLVKVHNTPSYPEASSRDQEASYMPWEPGWRTSYNDLHVVVLITSKAVTN